jgi:hypothetical protein
MGRTCSPTSHFVYIQFERSSKTVLCDFETFVDYETKNIHKIDFNGANSGCSSCSASFHSNLHSKIHQIFCWLTKKQTNKRTKNLFAETSIQKQIFMQFGLANKSYLININPEQSFDFIYHVFIGFVD